jgi:flagella basal body P-ring formation protein FlgA
MKNIFTFFAFLFSFAFSANSFAQEFSDINNPVFADEDDYVESQDFKPTQYAYNKPIAASQLAPTAQIEQDLNSDTALAEKDFAKENFDLAGSVDIVKEKIADKLQLKNLSLENLTFSRFGGKRTFTLEQVKSSKLMVKFTLERIEVTEDKDEFIALLKPISGNYSIEMKGEFSMSQKIPFISRNIQKGTVITQDDVELKDYPKNKIGNDYVTEISEIIGKAANKNLNKNTPVFSGDIKNPVVITKNSTVSAIYKNNAIEVKALAVALEDGGAGDVIRLKNFDSGKQFKGLVQEDGSVLVSSL